MSETHSPVVKITPDDIVKREYVFGIYSKSIISDKDDIIAVKEKLHKRSGAIEDNLRIVPNYLQKFYITKEQYRDHETKKEFENIEKLDEYESTRAELVGKASKLLKLYPARSVYDINASPYIYGTDVTTPVLLHHEYDTKWPDTMTDSSLAVMDYETDMVTAVDGKATEFIIAGSITYKDKACLAVTRKFVEKFGGNVEKEIRRCFTKHLAEYEKSRNIKLEIEIVNSDADVVIQLFKRAHLWHPDFLGFWNMKFDINKALESLKRYDIRPEDVFCDPSIPYEYRRFTWIEDQLIKVTSAGKKTPKHHADLWHKVLAPASFYCIDLMCLYKRLRVGKAQKNSYALDATLKNEINIGKLKFTEADDYSGGDWHYFMQYAFPIEYLIYNIFDCIAVELLDEHTGDVARGLRPAVGISEIQRLNSNPKRLIDTIHFSLLKKGKVIGSTSSDMTEELDSCTFPMTNWIIALPAELQYKTGKHLIKEYPALETNIILHSWDTDITSSYPTHGLICNVAKSTSRIEVCGLQGMDDMEARSIGINLSSVKTNALMLARQIYDFPTMDELLLEFTTVN